jgi:hypothetical protein
MLFLFSFLLIINIFSQQPASAASVSDLDKLVHLGIVKESERKKIKNIQAPIKKLDAYILFLRLSGLEGKAKSFKGKATYKDSKNVAKEYIPYLNYSKANPHLGWDKNSANFFPDSTLTIKEFTKYMLDVLGYKQNIDYLAEEQLDFAKKIYLLTEEDVLRANSKLTLKDTYRIILASMKVFTKDQQLFSSVLIKKKIVNSKFVQQYNLHISTEESKVETHEIEMEIEE